VPTLEPERWLQWNVQLDRSRASAESSARAVFEALRPLLREWKRKHSLRWFFFMRKRPDMRLRFCGPDVRRQLNRKLSSVLDSLVSTRIVRRVFESVYEPETRVFGGPQAMRLVHAYFHADAAAWMELDRLAQSASRVVSSEHLAAGVLNDLFFRTLEDRNEVWDVWSNLSAGSPRNENDQAPAFDIAGLLSQDLTPAEARVLKRYNRANQVLAKGLCRLWAEGALSRGLRAILTSIAVFHFNRHGLPPCWSIAIARNIRDRLAGF